MADFCINYFVNNSTIDDCLTSNKMIKQQNTEAFCTIRVSTNLILLCLLHVYIVIQFSETNDCV